MGERAWGRRTWLLWPNWTVKRNALDAARRSWVTRSGKRVQDACMRFISRTARSRIKEVVA